MWPFKGAPRASPKRVSDLEALCDDNARAIEWLRKACRDLNARLAAVQRTAARAQEAPAPTNGDEPPAEYTPRPVEPTAHLSRRFRGV